MTPSTRISEGLCPVPDHGELMPTNQRPTAWCGACERGYQIRDRVLVVDRPGKSELLLGGPLLDMDANEFDTTIRRVIEEIERAMDDPAPE